MRPTVLHDLVATEREDLLIDTPAGVIATVHGSRDGLPAVAVRRTARRIADALLALPEPATAATVPTAAVHAA